MPEGGTVTEQPAEGTLPCATSGPGDSYWPAVSAATRVAAKVVNWVRGKARLDEPIEIVDTDD